MKASASDEKLPHDLRDASAELLGDLHDMGPAIYHHHYHNAIVGRSDAPFRYNRKWNAPRSPDINDSLTNTIGAVKTGAFGRGQGGIYEKTEIPAAVARTTSNLNKHSPTKSSANAIGMGENWSMHKSYSRYKKQMPYKLPSERLKELYGKVIKLHSQSPRRSEAEDHSKTQMN